MSHSHHGQCLCGAVKLAAQFEEETIEACHCGMCRNWSSGPFMSVHPLPGVKFDGEENITRYASSEWAERGFCKVCGSHLFYTLKEQDKYFLSAGLFDASKSFVFTKEIYIDSKAGNYTFANDTQKLTEEEVMAAVGQV